MSNVWMINMTAVIPEKLPPVDYFLKEINNPQTIYSIRLLAAGVFLIILAVPYHYRKKQKTNSEELK